MAKSKTPGLLKRGNIDLSNRPSIRNPDGSHSSVRSISITDDRKRAYLIPTVIPQPRGNGYYVASNKAAVEHFRVSGQHLGYFKDEVTANKYADRLHRSQAKLGAIRERMRSK